MVALAKASNPGSATQDVTPRIPFSAERFLEAIVRFIVTNDEVCINFLKFSNLIVL
jgi:hypothetical protein